MKNIISCSRRTDIPAFHYKWLQDALKAKEAIITNPYSNMESQVSLAPEDVHSIVLWSKNFKNVIQDPDLLSDYNLYFQFTITGYSNLLEPNVILCDEAIEQVKQLSQKYSPNQIMWRFDPILFCEDEEFVNWNRIDAFKYLSKEIAKTGVQKCTISFMTSYDKVNKRLADKNIKVKDTSDDEKVAFTEKLVEIANENNIQIYSCSDTLIEHVVGVKQAHCIDGDLLEELFGDKTSKSKDKGQRLSCGCSVSKDIGNYKLKCGHKCLYCYANPF